MSECPEYRPWEEVEGSLVKIRECSHFWDGRCENSQAPHAGQRCSWEGRPDKQGPEAGGPGE